MTRRFSTHLFRLRVAAPALLLLGGAVHATACIGDEETLDDEAALDCSVPRPGCGCTDEGMKVVCGETVGGTDSQPVCGKGTATCTEGVWSACDIDGDVTLAPSGGPGSKPLTQGSPTGCADPCDVYCNTFNDDPNGEGNSGTGIVEGNGGITLPGNNGSPIPSNCSGGTVGTCSHTFCQPGAPLTPDCDGVTAPPTQGPAMAEIAFQDDFKNSNGGWSLGAEWGIGPANSSNNHQFGNPDPNNDTSPGGNKGIAGVVIGGNAATTVHGWRYLTSPVIDTSKYNVSLTLAFNRWLNSDYPPYMNNQIQVFDGSSWVTIWTGTPTDSSWQSLSYDVSSFANPSFRFRFGFMVGDSGVYRVSSWNIDDVVLTGELATTMPGGTGGSCVSTVCAIDPSCCTTEWSVSCVQTALNNCPVVCNCTSSGEFLPCYNDGYDHDGDGYTGQDGDCLDCDPTVNAGAFDFVDTIDNDCNGTIDDEVLVCDNNLALSNSNPLDHAKAIDLCRTTTASATGASKTWGVYTSDARLVQADASSTPHNRSYGLMSQFGNSQNAAFKGNRLAVYSSGTARVPGQPSYVDPNGQVASFNQGTDCAFPAGFPANAAGCPATAGNANDSTGLFLKIRVPTNAQSFSYNFRYFSSEYPEWLCTIYNDHFVGLLESNQNVGNISFDSMNNPVSVNVGFFNVPGCPTCTSNVLTNTGFDGTCSGQICGGATDWLQTSAPVDPGEEITMHFSVWDQGDHVWDSSVLIDNWTWSAQPALVDTQPVTPPSTTTYADGTFVRDYDASGVCPQGHSIRWTDWSWTATTPSDSQIAFSVATADSLNGLNSAPVDALIFSSPPWPNALNGDPAIAKDGNPTDTQVGSVVVEDALMANSRPLNKPFLRVISYLEASSDLTAAPTLLGWNQQFECVPLE